MLKNKKSSFMRNNKGMAVFEMIPIIIVIILFINFSLGFFGSIHTGILNSIAARNYAFETFRNRSNLVYFRSTTSASVEVEYSKEKFRFHGITSEKKIGKDSDEWISSTRLIDFANSDKRAADITGNEKTNHAKVQGIPDGRNESIGANPIWIKTAYGICLSAECKP